MLLAFNVLVEAVEPVLGRHRLVEVCPAASDMTLVRVLQLNLRQTDVLRDLQLKLRINSHVHFSFALFRRTKPIGSSLMGARIHAELCQHDETKKSGQTSLILVRICIDHC